MKTTIARRVLTVLASAALLGVGVANPADAAARSGTWEADVFYVHWSADNTWTQIEPHFLLNDAYPGVCRMVGGTPRYYLGDPVRNNLSTEHKTSRVTVTDGSAGCGNFFQEGGQMHWL